MCIPASIPVVQLVITFISITAFCGVLFLNLCNASILLGNAATDAPLSSFLCHSFMTLSSCLLLSRSLQTPEFWIWATSWVAQNRESFSNKMRSSPFSYKGKRPKQQHQSEAAGCLALLSSHLWGGNFPFWRSSGMDVAMLQALEVGSHWGTVKVPCITCVKVPCMCMALVCHRQLLQIKLLPSGRGSMSLNVSLCSCICACASQQWDESAKP